MVSHLHENLVEMFRNKPDFAADLLSGPLGISVPPFEQAQVAPGDFNNVLPTEFRADLVIKLTTADQAVLAVIVEAQLRHDTDKRRSWPAYVATLHARLGCPVALLVMCPSRTTATKCAEPILFGIPDLILTPLVIGPLQVPPVTDTAVATQHPELTILSAMAHGSTSPDQKLIFEALLAALDVFDEDHSMRYGDVIISTLDEEARVYLEKLMTAAPYQFQSSFARRYVDKGRTEGKAEGRTEGKAEGKVEGKVEAILAVLDARGIKLTDEARDRITSCTSFEDLDTWVTRAAVITTADELFS